MVIETPAVHFDTMKDLILPRKNLVDTGVRRPVTQERPSTPAEAEADKTRNDGVTGCPCD